MKSTSSYEAIGNDSEQLEHTRIEETNQNVTANLLKEFESIDQVYSSMKTGIVSSTVNELQANNAIPATQPDNKIATITDALHSLTIVPPLPLSLTRSDSLSCSSSVSS